METLNDTPVQGVAERAEEILRRSTYAGIRQLTCTFRDGVLTIRGNLSSFYQKQLAQTVLRRIDGVAQIVNHVRVE